MWSPPALSGPNDPALGYLSCTGGCGIQLEDRRSWHGVFPLYCTTVCHFSLGGCCFLAGGPSAGTSGDLVYGCTKLVCGLFPWFIFVLVMLRVQRYGACISANE
jgi:hypothetical protein